MLTLGLFVAALVLVPDKPKTPAELVMAPGCEIAARTSKGVIRVQAGAVIPPGKGEAVMTRSGPLTLRATELYPRTYY